MPYSNDPLPNPYVGQLPTLPNIPFPKPFWINKLRSMIWIGCTNPDLFAIASALGAAAEVFWTIETPATKQIVSETTGLSWICGAKTLISGTRPGTSYGFNEISGRAMYGALAGEDTATYFGFVANVWSNAIASFLSMPTKLKRVCNGSQSPYVGITPRGGWPSPTPNTWGPGWDYLNANGDGVGTPLTVKPGQIAIIVASVSFSCLSITGGVNATVAIINTDTEEVYDIDTVDNFDNVTQHAVVSFFSPEGRFKSETRLSLAVHFNASLQDRVVPVTGRGYIRAFDPGAGDAPPYFSMQHMTKSSAEAD